MMRDEVNFLHEVNREAIEFIEAGGDLRAYPLLRPYVVSLVFNTKHPLLRRREVRIALNEADQSRRGRAERHAGARSGGRRPVLAAPLGLSSRTASEHLQPGGGQGSPGRGSLARRATRCASHAVALRFHLPAGRGRSPVRADRAGGAAPAGGGRRGHAAAARLDARNSAPASPREISMPSSSSCRAAARCDFRTGSGTRRRAAARPDTRPPMPRSIA